MKQVNSSKRSLPFFGLPQIWPYIKPYKGILIRMIVLGAISSLIDIIYPLFNRYAINHFVGQKTLDTIHIFILLYLAILMFQVVDNYVNIYLCGKIEMYTDRDLRNAAFNHLQELSFSYFNQNNVGAIHARVMSDTGKIGEMVAWHVMNLVWYGSYILFAIIMMVSIHVKLACYVLLLVPVAVLLISFFQKKLIVQNRKVREMNARITGDFNEGITGAKSIKTMVIEERMQQEFTEDTGDMKRYAVRTAHYSSMFAAMVTFMSSMALAIVLWKGGQITLEQVMELGTLSVFMSYALGMLEPIQNIINTISVLIAIQANIERFTTLMQTKSDVTDSQKIIERYGDTFSPKYENWEALQGDIEFKNVSFQYPDGDELVLENFSLKVPAGTNVAIVGETGAGKSTLVNLVCRFFEPTKGQIFIDGKDVKERSQLWLHSNLGYALQTPHLFSGTVRENLKYGNPQASDEEIWKALKLVSADFVVHKLERGLDSEVGEGGGMLSTGEKQLLSFARALLADPKILILDEATSSIDTMTEKLIQGAIKTVIKGRTSFVIAHRLSTIVDADLILVVKDGKIMEQGDFSYLMKQHGYFYELYTRQYEDLAVDLI